MKFLRAILGMLVSLALLLVVVGFFLPTEYDVSRVQRVAAPCETAFAQVDDLGTHASWMPWIQDDPSVRIELGEPSKGEGARFRWTSERSGSGIYTLRKSEPYAKIESEIDMGEMGKTRGYFSFEGEGQSCEIVWGLSGEGQGPRPLAGWFATLMDAMVGRDFERGLRDLATLIERRDP